MPKLFYWLLMPLLFISPKTYLPDSRLAKEVRTTVWPRIKNELAEKGLKITNPIYLRIFKDQSVLEIWVRSGPRYQFFKSYNICYFSGGLGTKTRTGDGKSPEGFYNIGPGQLNPASNYYLAINIGYPNKVEKLKGYTGDAIMVHGHCASIGCYAMTNPGIEEIYTMVYKAFEAGQQKVRLDIFPFRMDDQRMKAYAAYPWIPFWKTMRPGYALFEKNHTPQVPGISEREYHF